MLTLVPSLGQESNQPENMRDIVLEMVKGGGGTVSRMSD